MILPEIRFKLVKDHKRTGWRTKTDTYYLQFEPVDDVDDEWSEVLDRIGRIVYDSESAWVPNDIDGSELVEQSDVDIGETFSFEEAVEMSQDTDREDVVQTYDDVQIERTKQERRQQARDRLELKVNNVRDKGSGEGRGQYAIATIHDSETGEERTYRYFCFFDAGSGYERVDGDDIPDYDEVLLEEEAPITQRPVMMKGGFDPVATPDDAEDKAEYLSRSTVSQSRDTPVVDDGTLYVREQDIEDCEWIQILDAYDKHSQYGWTGRWMESDSENQASRVSDGEYIRTSDDDFYQVRIEGAEFTLVAKDEDEVKSELRVEYSDFVDEFLSFGGYCKLTLDELENPIYLKQVTQMNGRKLYQRFRNPNLSDKKVTTEVEPDKITLTVYNPQWDGRKCYDKVNPTFQRSDSFEYAEQTITVEQGELNELTEESIERLEQSPADITDIEESITLNTGETIQVEQVGDNSYNITGDIERENVLFETEVYDAWRIGDLLTVIIEKPTNVTGISYERYIVMNYGGELETKDDVVTVDPDEFGDTDTGWVQIVYDYNPDEYKYNYHSAFLNNPTEIGTGETVYLRNNQDAFFELSVDNGRINATELEEDEFQRRVSE